MALTIYIIGSLLIVSSLGLYIGFTMSEGKDERRQSIIAKRVKFIYIYSVGICISGRVCPIHNTDS